MRLALIVEYEGTDYHGFQYQANVSSVQDELEIAIQRLSGEKVRVKGAGRTDAGVHASGQVVAFDTKSSLGEQKFVSGLNFYLPEDIGVKAAYVVEEYFHPRRNALSRKYSYTILNSVVRSPLLRRVVHVIHREMNVTHMQRGAKLLVGMHDFGNFTGPLGDQRSSTMGNIFNASVRKEGDIVTYDVEARSFLTHQVRRMAGSLVDVGLGKLTIEEFQLMICENGGEFDVNCLPPQGLCLTAVTYANFPPRIDE